MARHAGLGRWGFALLLVAGGVAPLAVPGPAAAAHVRMAQHRAANRMRTSQLPGPAVPAPPPAGYLAPLDVPGQDPGSAGAASTVALARSSGHPALVGSMTTQTMTVSALPHGGFRLREFLLPVRVRQRVRRAGRLVSRWVPVSTALRRAGGLLRPAAVPGDEMAFSDGGPGPLASLSAGGKRLALWWPGRLPAPAVSGASARYRDVLPGIDLVLTATSQQAGGFWVSLVIRDQAAARGLALRGLALRVTARGTRLERSGDGGLMSVPGGLASSGIAGQPVTTWDSGRLSPPGSRHLVAAAVRAARRAGAALAPPGSGLGGDSGPAPGALVAQTSVAASGRVLSLVPAAGVLQSGSVRYPLHVGTEFTAQPALAASTLPVPTHSRTGGTQAYDVLKQACPGSQLEVPDSTYAKNGGSYSWLGVGYDDWPFGDCLVNGTYVPGYSYAAYQFAVPSKVDGSVISSAAGQDSGVHAWETWSADCTSSANVTASWSGPIDSDTDWSNTAWHQVTDLVTTNVPPDTSSPDPSHPDTNCGGPQAKPVIDGNCSQTQLGSCPNYLPVFFKMPAGDGSVLQNAANGGWNNLTVRLWEKANAPAPQGSGGTNDLVWKQFSNNPYLEVFYNDPPNMPTGGQISDGGSKTGCLQNNSGNYPRVGHQSADGVTAYANFSDDDTDSMTGKWEYKLDSSTTWNTVDQGTNPPVIGTDTPGNAIIPASWINAITTDGTVVDWRVQANDGAAAADGGQSAWSGTCHFKVYTTPPPEPTISAFGSPTCPAGTPAGTIVPGCSQVYLIESNDAGTDPATKIVWTMDQNPPDANPPSGEVVNLPSGDIGAAVTVTIPSPGPHVLYAYVVDQARVNSKTGVSAHLVASGDPTSTFASFGDALAAGASWDNQMISSASSSPGTADGDGGGSAIDENVLKQAGWLPNKAVTIDGATFKLPGFGTANTTDNVLAAGQTIDMPAGSQGTSLVFLATSTNATAAAPLAKTASYPATDRTAPYVPGNSPVTGLECDEYQSGLTQTSPAQYCQIPLGNVNYTTASGAAQEKYNLTVPDWITGPAGDAALQLAGGWDTPSGVSQYAPNIYAFSVPLNPNAIVQSVTLPDVGASVSAVPGVSPGAGLPALHIFGMAIANTTTATPGSSNGNLQPGQTWTAAWASPTEAVDFTPTGTGWGGSTSGQTIRTTMTVAAGGPQVRLRLSDDLGWYVGTSTTPLRIGAVSVAQAGTGGALTGTIHPATFNGSGSVNIPEGGDAYSDPISMNVTPGERLAVSIYLTGTYPYLVQHLFCTACTSYVTANNGGDQTGSPGASAFVGGGSQISAVLTSVDVQTSGVPTVAVLGDNVLDAFQVSDVPATAPRLSDDLAAELISAAGGGQPGFSVISEGIEANGLLSESMQLPSGGTMTSGPSAAARLPEDVLSEPNVGTVIIDQGLEDLLNGQSASTLASTASALVNYRYPILIDQLQDWGITPVVTTLTPCAGYNSGADACTTGTGTVDDKRVNVVNAILIGQYGGSPGCPLVHLPLTPFFDNLDSAVSNGKTPEALQNGNPPSDYDPGDHLNLTKDGFAALASVFPGPSQASPPPSFCQFQAVIPQQY